MSSHKSLPSVKALFFKNLAKQIAKGNKHMYKYWNSAQINRIEPNKEYIDAISQKFYETQLNNELTHVTTKITHNNLLLIKHLPIFKNN